MKDSARVHLRTSLIFMQDVNVQLLVTVSPEVYQISSF